MTLDSFDELSQTGLPPSATNPIALYVSTDYDTRRVILTCHPDVTVFLFLEEGYLIKSYFPTKIHNWDQKLPATPSPRYPEPPPRIPRSPSTKKTIFRDNPYLVESLTFYSSDKTISIRTHLKENKEDFVGVIPTYTEEKTKNILLVFFPAVLPFIRSHSFTGGEISDDNITETFIDTHELCQDWLQLNVEEFAVVDDFFKHQKSGPYPKPPPSFTSTTS